MNPLFLFSPLLLLPPSSTRPAHPLRRGDNFFESDLRVLAPEVVVLRQEEHAVALLPLPHRDARAVPEALRRLGPLVVVVPAGAERGPELVLVLGEALDDDGGDGLVDAEVGAGAGEGRERRGRKGGREKRVSFFFFFSLLLRRRQKASLFGNREKANSQTPYYYSPLGKLLRELAHGLERLDVGLGCGGGGWGCFF